MSMRLMLIFILTFFFEPSSYASYAGRGLEVTSFKGYSRLTIPVKPNSGFKVEGFEDSVKVLNVAIENMHQAYWTQSNRLSDQLIRNVKTSSMGDATIRVSIEIRGSYSKHFIYYQPNPPSVIVDIWQDKKGSAQKKGKEAKLAKKFPSKVKRVSKKANHELSSKSVSKVSESVSKIPEVTSKIKKIIVPLDFSNNSFFRLPIIAPAFVYEGKNFNTSREGDPGAGWEWTKSSKNAGSGTNFSLAIKLYKSKKYGLAIRAAEYLRRDYPNSPYMEEVRFLEALSYWNLSVQSGNKAMGHKALAQFKELIPQQKNGKNLPFSQKLRIFFAADAFREGRWLDTASHFESILGNQENSKKEPDFPGILLAHAEAYFNLRQYRRASRVYRAAMQKYPKHWVGKEAAYRFGNTLAKQRFYKKANLAIREALKKYPDYESTRSEAYLNLAEVNFWLKNLSEAQKFFKIYAKKHHAHTYVAMAYVRLGEIEEIKNKNIKKAREYYLKAIDHFPFSLGERLAQVRLARLEFFNNRDPDFQIAQMRKNLSSKELPRQVKEMSSIQLIRFLNKNGRPNEAIRLAEDEVAKSDSKNYKIFKSIYIETLLLNVEDFIDRGEYEEALAFYEKNRQWLEQGKPDIWLLLAKVYKALRLYNTSSTFMGRYIEAQKRINGRRMPSSLAKTRDDALHVKARLLYLQGRYQHAIDNLTGNSSLEACHLRMQAYMKLGNLVSAFKMARSVQAKLNSLPKELSKTIKDQIQIDTIEVLSKHFHKRKEYKRQIEVLQVARKNLNSPYERFEFLLGDIYWYRQDYAKAIVAFKEALELFPKSKRSARASYRLGLAYSSIGDRKNAVKTLTPIAENSQNIWGQSARQELNLLQWEEKYSVILGDSPPSGLGLEL